MAFDFAGVLIDAVYFNQLTSEDCCILHSGDSLAGEAEGYDEVIKLDLDSISLQTQVLVFVINAFQGGDFSCVESAYAEIVQTHDGGENAKIA